MNIELRPYQSDFIKTSVERHLNGIKKQLGVLFTGAGKTFTTIKLIEKYAFKRVLWLCYQTELVEQSALAFSRDKFSPEYHGFLSEAGFLETVKNNKVEENGFSIGLIKADVFKTDCNIVMGSVMTVYNRLDKLPADYFDCIICDEAHLFGSLSSYNTINYFTPGLLLGLTATPYRADGMMMGDIFDEIIFDYGLDKGIKDGYACELDAVRVKTNTQLDKVRTTAGEFNQKDLSETVDNLARNQLIVESYKKYCEGRQAIFYCVDIKHAINLAEQFKMNGYDCEAVSSDEELTPDRSEKINRFKKGTLQIITNVNILVAGFDHPDTGCIGMACPTKSLTKFLQAVGRGARLKSKNFVAKFGQKCIVLDIVDVTSKHNLVNTWELDRKLPVEDRLFVSKEKKEKLLEARRNPVIQPTRNQDEIVSLLKIPQVRINKSIRSREPATEKQLQAIKNMGYDIENKHYTKYHVNVIFASQPVWESKVRELKEKGYDTSGVVTISMYNEAIKDWEARQAKKNKKPYW